MRIPFIKKFQLWLVRQIINWLNFVLDIFNEVLFAKLKSAPRNILIYRIGNVGDTTCAIPSFIAIRRMYPKAKITLLTSPSIKRLSGAKELLDGAWYLNEFKVYYTDEISSWREKINFIRNLKKERYDLFIQFPDDLARFRTVLRNMFMAKFIGAKSAIGFRIRTVKLFWKTQIDYLIEKNEAENLLEILESYGIKKSGKIEFSFNIPKEFEENAGKILKKKWGRYGGGGGMVAAICPGSNHKEKKWPAKRFAKVAEYLNSHYSAKIVILGGEKDIQDSEVIKKHLSSQRCLSLVGKLNLLGSLAVLKKCDFLLSNDSGLMHIAAVIGKPVVALFSIRNILGRWFPYGQKHKILYYKFISCDYNEEKCIKKSIDLISIKEVISACDKLISK